MRAPRFWTPDRIAEVRRCLNLEMTSAQIAAHLGCTVPALRKAIYGKGITSRSKHAFNQSRRMKGRKDSAETRAKKAEVLRRRWADPEGRAKLEPGQLAASAKTDWEKVWTTRRGFALPLERRDEYFAIRAQKFSAREAGTILGLIPASREARP